MKKIEISEFFSAILVFFHHGSIFRHFFFIGTKKSRILKKFPTFLRVTGRPGNPSCWTNTGKFCPASIEKKSRSGSSTSSLFWNFHLITIKFQLRGGPFFGPEKYLKEFLLTWWTYFEKPILSSVSSKFMITCSIPILVHFSIVRISDLVQILTSNRNRTKFEL